MWVNKISWRRGGEDNVTKYKYNFIHASLFLPYRSQWQTLLMRPGTKELSDAKLPNVRDYDSSIYVRQLASSFMMGVFEKEARPWDVSKHGVDPDWHQIKVLIFKKIFLKHLWHLAFVNFLFLHIIKVFISTSNYV